jgi:hypothetical protein
VDTVTVENLWPGSYTISETPLAGWTVDVASQNRSIVSGGSNTVTFRNDKVQQVPASLGDYVWNDTNQNGVQDSGETPVAGVTVTLSTVCGGAVLATQVTDANGKYLFDNLQPGDYVVHFELPAGYLFTGAHQGGNDATDSDANVITGCTPVINLSAGENDLTWDAGLYQPPVQPILGALGDTVWFDENKNGIQDVGEEGVPNVKVDLYSADDTFLKTDTTDADGKYLFTDLPAGSYYVTFADVAGYNFTLYDADNNAQDAEDSDPLVPVVALSVSTAEEEGVLGKDLTYTFMYTNTDSSRNAVDVVISTTVPVGSVFQPAASNAAWQCTSAEAGGVCTLSIDQLAPNASGSALFVVKLKNTVDEVPDPLNLVVSLTEGTSAQTEVVDLGAGETNLTVDAGLVRNVIRVETPTSTGPTGLPGEEQPGSNFIFLPSLSS